MKNFDKWNESKKKVELSKRTRTKIGGVYWCSLGINIGFEQNGNKDDFQRPVIVIKKFSKYFVLVAPLTTKKHDSDWYFHINLCRNNNWVILNQIKPIDVKRLTDNFTQISKNKSKEILAAYIKLIDS